MIHNLIISASSKLCVATVVVVYVMFVGTNASHAQESQQLTAKEASAKGDAFYFGKGVEKDFVLALKWFKIAANKNHPYAQYSLGYMLERGQGCNEDISQAVQWYRRAAELGHKDSQAEFAEALQKGRGATKDVVAAASWYEKAAEQGHVESMIRIGKLYQKGQGVDLDFASALKWYRKAELAENDDAQSAIQSIYFPSELDEGDARELAKWLTTELEKTKDDRALASLGLAILAVNGLEIDQTRLAPAFEGLLKSVLTENLTINTRIFACRVYNMIAQRKNKPELYRTTTQCLQLLLEKNYKSLTFDQKTQMHDDLGNARQGLGEINLAETEFRKLLRLYEERGGAGDDLMACVARRSLALLIGISGGDPKRSIELFKKNSAVYLVHLERDKHDSYLKDACCSTFSFIGTLFQQLGDIDKAILFHGKAVALVDGKTEASDLPVSENNEMPFHNLAECYRTSGDFVRAEKMWRSLLKFREGLYGKSHNMTHGALNGLARTLVDLDRVREAQAIFQRMDKSSREIGDNWFIGSSNYAAVLWKRGELVEAELLLKDAVDARSGQREQDSRRRTLVEFYSTTSNVPNAVALQEKTRRSEAEFAAKRLAFLSGERREQYLTDSFKPEFQKALNLGLKHRTDRRAASLSAGWLLNGKSVSQDVLAESALLSSEELAPKVEQLRTIRNRLAITSLGSNRTAEVRQRIASLESQQSTLESELTNLGHGDAVGDRWKSIGSLMSVLPYDSRMVNIARVTEYDFRKSFESGDPQWGDDRYVAWVIPPVGEGQVECIDLGLAKPIDEQISKVRATLLESPNELSKVGEKQLEQRLLKSLNELSALVYTPIAKQVKDASELIISPDGELWSIPFEILRHDDQYLIESKRIRYVASGRELLLNIKPRSGVEAPVVFANPDYDLKTDAITGSKPNEQFALRSVTNSRFPALAYSASEAKAIVPAIQTYVGTKPKEFLSASAQEAAFKNLHRPQVLAISTHGYFDSSESNTNPLLRCGLALAGANNRQQAAAEGKEDGILTGLEIVGTDLRGTELVVLSACETGLGDIQNGEGVAGLRQAFQLAGAESVVSSLWQVEDGETARLMKLFFENLADGKSKSESLRQAQLTRIKARRARHGAAHPFFWAAFTLTGQD